MKRVRGTIGFMAVTLCLVLVAAFCVVQTVKSQTNISEEELTEYYRVKEKELVRETRDFLEDAGFSNSGVTLTRVINSEGEREYTMTIHHGKIDKMDETERENLRGELTTFTFQAENCRFYHTFLIND